MKHSDEYRDGNLARAMAATIARETVPGRHYQFMEFCGGHTHAISRYGIEDLLPANVQMVHGPGCPVCVLPVGRIDDAILDPSGGRAIMVDGFVGPAHVSAVTGTHPYESIAAEFAKPVVVAGFEPLDVVHAVLMLVRQINEGRHDVENQYFRLVTQQGNRIAQRAMEDVFEPRPSFEWRGLGELPRSALRLRDIFSDLDAERRFGIETVAAADNPGCECGEVLRGLKKPAECKLFGTLCSPETPMGSCMVSPEGACSAHWTYGRFRDRRRTGT